MDTDATEQNYGSTLAFSVVCSSFDDDDRVELEAPAIHITRTYDKISTHLSQNGSWHCVFTETKKLHSVVIDLNLSLTWVPRRDASNPLPASQELVGRIRSVQIRSDTTLSELFADRVDGREILRGATTQFRLLSDQVFRNGRYMFRIIFHTQDISWFRCQRDPLFTTFLDINPEFDPTLYRPDEPPDVCFQFPINGRDPIVIHAHTSVLEPSRHFAQQLAGIALKKEDRKRSLFDGTSCTITDFSPAVFRVMLRYLYTGKVEVTNQLEELEDSRFENKGRTSSEVYFEDVYRIAQRYGIETLKSLSLKAIQCNFNMTIAISILAKLPKDACQQEFVGLGESFEGEDDHDRFFRDTQIGIAKDIVKEYILFYSTEVNLVNRFEGPVVHNHPSIQERREMISEIGDSVLSNMARLWTKN